jgi:hypothetical protein
VYRPSLSRFMFGQVLDFQKNDENGLQFHMLFGSFYHTSSEKEWLIVASKPFKAYLQHHQQGSRQNSHRATVSSTHCTRPPCQNPEFPMEMVGRRSDNFGPYWSDPYRHESNVSNFLVLIT